MIALTAMQVYAYAKQAGFQPPVAETMVAIARRESNFDPTAHNGNEETGDDSYGLWQINWSVQGIRDLLSKNGITDPIQLQNPAMCAKAAFLLYGGRLSNLYTAWYINRPGIYKDRFEQHLPEAHWAALMSELQT